MRPSLDWRFRRADGAARPLLYGHRGARAHVTENTLEAFARAATDGADGIELDVRLTADDRVLVLHDLDFARVTDGSQLTRASLLDAATATSIELRGGLHAPLLDDVFDWLDRSAPTNLRVNVELKHDEPRRFALAAAVASLLRAWPRVAERALVSSFEPRLLAWSKRLSPEIPAALIFHEGQRLARTPAPQWIARAMGLELLHPERTLCSPDAIAAWRSLGAIVNVWTVAGIEEAIDLAALGVDGLITDDPGAVREAFERAAPVRSAG